MAYVASQLIEEVTAYAQSDSLEDVREICADGTYFPNNLRNYMRSRLFVIWLSFQIGNKWTPTALTPQTKWSIVLLEKLTVPRLIKKNSPHCMESECSLPHSQKPATRPYPEPDQPSPRHARSIYWKSILTLSSYLRLGLPNSLFSSVYPPKSHTHFSSPP